MKAMFRWVDPRGAVVAEVLQGARLSPTGPRAVYIARVAGEQVEKQNFSCAKRVIDEWLRANGVRATPVAT
jgi:hypothetical protein